MEGRGEGEGRKERKRGRRRKEGKAKYKEIEGFQVAMDDDWVLGMEVIDTLGSIEGHLNFNSPGEIGRNSENIRKITAFHKLSH